MRVKPILLCLIPTIASVAFGAPKPARVATVKKAAVVHPQFGNLAAAYNMRDAKLVANMHEAFKDIEESAFQIGRTFGGYSSLMRFSDNGRDSTHEPVHSLVKSLRRLDAQSHVIDLGAGGFGFIHELLEKFDHKLALDWEDYGGVADSGDFVALANHFAKAGKPNMTGVTMTKFEQQNFMWDKRESLPSKEAILSHPKINAIVGRYFEDIPDHDLTTKFGKADVVTDYSGVMAYSLNAPLVIGKLSRIMKSGAELWVRDNHVRFRTATGDEMTQAEFLGSLPGFERLLPDDGTGDKDGVNLIRRTAAEMKLPKMKLTSFVPGRPSKMVYQLEEPFVKRAAVTYHVEPAPYVGGRW